MRDSLFNIRQILLIRWKQLYRMLFQLGLIRLVVLLIVLFFLLAAVYTNSVWEQRANFISIIWLIMIYFINIKRKDKLFLRIVSNHLPLICFVEYLLISLPIIICLLLHIQWQALALIVAGIICIPFIHFNWKKKNKTLNTRLQRWIPFDMYEWKASLRKYFYIILILWMIGLCTSFFVASIPIVLFVIGLLFSECYETNESWQMLLACQKSSGKFLYCKIKQHITRFSLLVLPLIIAFMIFHWELYYIVVIEFIILLSIHIYCIVLKYAFYSHDRSAVNPVFLMVGIFVGLIPITTPLLWLFSIYFFLKAQTNLYFYLHDYN
jgi:hypothetical protein